jgi:O-antigen/teichoic acid export membrane protein
VLARVMHEHGVAWQRPRREDFSQLLSFGLPSMLASMLIGPVMLLTLVIVSRKGGYAEVGLFQATQQFRNVLLFVGVQTASTVVPVLAATYGAQDRAGLARGLRWALGLALVSSVVLGLVLAVIAPLAMAGFGRDFGAHWTLLWWLALLAPVQAVNAIGSSALTAVGRPWMLLLSACSFAIAALLIAWIDPTARGLLLSQGLGSVAPLIVIGIVLWPYWTGRWVR